MLVATGARHTSISPAEHEPQRIEDWCAVHEVATDQWRHLLGGSADVLPRVETQPLDLLLIDGAHAFPLPAIDWYYGTRHLREGGLVIVDDLQLWPCRIVAEFLLGDDGWERTVAGDRFAVFRALGPGSQLTARWWGQQPYVVEQGDGVTAVARAVRALRARVRLRSRLHLDHR
ncbi:MAG: class I SAM-dependent methyltransferase [Actinobacteria bacterium]|nr:class I SAM-dependent methyltransferase [Actinomycetota bacterium]